MKKILVISALVLLVSLILSAQGNYAVRIEYDGSNNPVYVGKAVPGTSVITMAWQIAKYEYDGSGNMIAKKWAEGSEEFRFKWTTRSGYTYR